MEPVSVTFPLMVMDWAREIETAVIIIIAE